MTSRMVYGIGGKEDLEANDLYKMFKDLKDMDGFFPSLRGSEDMRKYLSKIGEPTDPNIFASFLTERDYAQGATITYPLGVKGVISIDAPKNSDLSIRLTFEQPKKIVQLLGKKDIVTLDWQVLKQKEYGTTQGASEIYYFDKFGLFRIDSIKYKNKFYYSPIMDSKRIKYCVAFPDGIETIWNRKEGLPVWIDS